MPRDASGAYSLPNGNPVVSGTVIDPAVHNATQTDIGTELTNSLDRGGRGAMTAPLPLDDTGTAAAPSLTFDGDTDNGFYRSAADLWHAACAGAEVERWSPGQKLYVDGTLAAPSIAFIGDSNTGFYRAGENDFRAVAGGAEIQRWTAAESQLAKNLKLTGAAPAAATGFSNTVTPKNIAKALARIETDGAGGATLLAGFNIASVDGSGANLVVNLTTALASADDGIAVATLAVQGLDIFLACQFITASQLQISGYDISDAAGVNFAARTLAVSLVVFGEQ